MFGFVFGALAGAAGYWAYQRYVVGTEDDAFADFETSSLDRPSPAEGHGRPSDTAPGYGDTGSTTSSTSPS